MDFTYLSNHQNLIPIIALISLWDIVWKGIALWRASQNKQTAWFIAILLLNTLGILPIYYLLVTKKRLSK